MRWLFPVFICFTLHSFAQVQDTLSVHSDEIPDYEPQTLLVQIDPGMREISEMEVNRPFSEKEVSAAIGGLFTEGSTLEIRRITDTPDGQKWLKVRLKDGENMEDAIKRLQDRDDILLVERSPVYSHTEMPAYEFDDPLHYLQYQFDAINAGAAINFMKGKGKTVVAVVDDALLYTHEDLKDNIHYNSGEMGTDSQGRDKRSNNIDDDGNGFVDDYRGWDFSNWDNNVSPPLNKAYYSRWGHGTFIAGLIGAASNNGRGIASVSDNHIEIMGLKCAEDNTDGRSYYHVDLGPAIKYAADNGAQVINMSWGGAGYSSYLRSFLIYAYNKNVILVSSAGNDNSSGIHYPASYPEVISVGSLTSSDQKSSFSNYGPLVDIYAPGSSLYSTRPYYYNTEGVYGYGSGTSFSGPLVAATCGLMKILEPNVDTEIARAMITSTGQNIDASNSISMGNGKLNMHRALLALDSGVGFLDFSIARSVVYPGETIDLTNNSVLVDPTTYEWHFPGGNPEYSNDPVPVVSFDKPGIYNFTMSVRDKNDNLLTSNEGNKITVEEPDLTSNITGYVPSEYANLDSIVKASDAGNLARKFPIHSDSWLIGFHVVSFNVFEQYRSLFIRVRANQNTTSSAFRFNESDIEFSESNDVKWNFLRINDPLPVKEGEIFISTEQSGFIRNTSGNLVFEQKSMPYIPSNESMYRSFSVVSNEKGELLIMPVIAQRLPENGLLAANRENACIGDTLRAEISNFDPSIDYTWWLASADVHFKGNRTARFSFPSAGRSKISVRSITTYDITKFDESFDLKYQIENSASFNILDCDEPPSIWFSARPRDEEDNRGVRITAGKRVNFDNESTNYTHIKWYFEGGDPQYSEEEKPIVTYAKPGNYRVKLRAKQFNGEYTTLLRKAYVAVEESPWQPSGNEENGGSAPASAFPLQHEVSIFPNPNQQGVLNISGVENRSEILIRTINGRSLIREVIDQNSSIGIGDLGTGMYLVEVRSSDGNVNYFKLLVE